MAGIVSLLAHVLLFPWVLHQRRVGAARTKAIVSEAIAETNGHTAREMALLTEKTRETVRGLLLDPEFTKALASALPVPKLGSDEAAAMAARRWAIQAEKDAKKNATRSAILAWAVSSFGDVVGGMVMKFLESNGLLTDTVLLGNDWMSVIGPPVRAFMERRKLSVQQAAPKEAAVFDPSNPYLRP